MTQKAKRRAVVFDIDGVICYNQVLLHDFLQTEPTEERWRDEWFAHIHEHPAHPGWVALANLLWHSGYTVILLTARPEYKRETTVEWLGLNSIDYSELVMRPDDCPYKDCKRLALAELQERYEICLAIDDDDLQVKEFEAAGVPTIHADNGLRAHMKKDDD